MGEFDHFLPPDNSQTTGEFDHLLSTNTQNVTKTNILDNYGNVIPQTAFQNPSQNISSNNPQKPQGVYQTLRNIITYPESGITGLLAGIGQYSGLNDGNSGNLQKSLETANQEMQTFRTNAQKNQGLEGVVSDPTTAAMVLQPELSPLKTALFQGLGQVISHDANNPDATTSGTIASGITGALMAGLGGLAQKGLNGAAGSASKWLEQEQAASNLPKIKGIEDKTIGDLLTDSKGNLSDSPEINELRIRFNNMGGNFNNLYNLPPETPVLDALSISHPGSFMKQKVFGSNLQKMVELGTAHVLGGPGVSGGLLGAMAIDKLAPKAIPKLLSNIAPVLGQIPPRIAPLISGLGTQYITKKTDRN